MKDIGITKGEWKSIFRNNHDRGVRSDKGFICFMTMPSHYPNQDVRYDEELEECRHDAELIADAGNTAQKCGLLPSELLKQRDDTIDKIETLVGYLKIWQLGKTPIELDALINEVEEWIEITKISER